MQSHYDELHDRYYGILTTKAGTRYERLAAAVFKYLHERNVVIHDLRLRGDSKVPHQIDVSIEAEATKQRVLIECKDLDVSRVKVGLNILRSFRSVLEDLKVEHGIVITCNGFTRHARMYAKSKGIKLVVMRKAEDADLDGLIQSVEIRLHVQSRRDFSVNLHLSPRSREVYEAETSRAGIAGPSVSNLDGVFLLRSGGRSHLLEFLEKQLDIGRTTRAEDGRWQVEVSAEGRVLQVGEEGVEIPFERIVLTYKTDVQTIPISLNVIAELVNGLGDDDILIYAEHLERPEDRSRDRGDPLVYPSASGPQRL